MYQLKYGQYALYDPRDDSLLIREPDVRLAIGEPGSLAFTVDADHPHVSQLQKLRGTVELLQDGSPIYRGRILRDERNWDNSRRIETEGLLAGLNDSIIPPFDFPGDFSQDEEYQTSAENGNVIAFFLGWLLAQHNAQVDSDRQIRLGTVTVTDSNNYIARSATDYATTWETVKGKLSDSALGGHLLPRYESDGIYLDYLADFTLTNMQPVEFGTNLLDLSDSIDAADIYTAILPIGAEGLTIEDLPDGQLTTDLVKEGKTIYSIAGRAAYGKIAKVMKWDDVTVAANLRSKAAELLATAGVLLTDSITVKACDLHCDDDQIAAFRVGRYIQLSSPPHGIERSFALVTLEPDILDPGNTNITLGATIKTQTERNQAQQAATAEKIEKQATAARETSDEIQSLRQSTTEQITTAIRTSESVIFEAMSRYVETGDLDSFRKEVSLQFQQTAEQLNLTFKTVTDRIDNVDGDLQRKYNERLKYIRFVDGNIVLGEEGNQITLTIENDRITFKQNGHDVAWFQSNQFFVTDAEFTNSVRIGNFAFAPGVGGNLSLKKVGD